MIHRGISRERARLRALLPGVFPVAALFFALSCLGHWIALPLLITYDGHEYLRLGELFGADTFWQAWNPLRTPGFPLALQVALSILGRNALAVQAVPLAFGAFGCLLIADSTRQIAGERAAAVTLVVLGLYPTLVAFEHMILTETGTFFFLALAVRLGVANPRTVRAAWLRALAFGLTLTAGYFWRQTVFAVLPLSAALQAASAWRLATGQKRLLLAALLAALVLFPPLALRHPWTSRFPATSFSARVLLDFAIRQAVIPPEEPALAPVAEEYREAIEEAEKTGDPAGITWPVVSQIGMRVALPPMAGEATRYVAWLIASYPDRYLAGMARTLWLFVGFDGGAGESKAMRGWVLAPATDSTLFALGPDRVPPRDREDFARRIPSGKLRRALRWLCAPYDRILVVCNLATAGLFLLALSRRDQRLLVLSGVPLTFALVHSLFLMSLDRFMVPIYPITLACGVVAAFLAAGRVLQKAAGRGIVRAPRCGK
jgi:hypothetical protein